MSQSSRLSRQGLWQQRFSIRNDGVITGAELDSLRQRLQSINRLLNRISGTLQTVRLHPLSVSYPRDANTELFENISEKLQLVRKRIATRLQVFSADYAAISDARFFSEVRHLVEDVDRALAECCSDLAQY